VAILTALVALGNWWSAAVSAEAASYPPALGCAVSGYASFDSGMVTVRGIGFLAGSRVLVSVDGRNTGAVRADDAGSFQVSWLLDAPTAGATITASDAGCSTDGALVIENQQQSSGDSSLLPNAPGPGSAARPPSSATPARHGRAYPSVVPTSAESLPPALGADPELAAIPSVPLTGLPRHLFLGLAGAVLLAGVALTGLTGRLGYRGKRPTGPSMVSAQPRNATSMKPDTA
jgi:hypothetical protein